MSKKIIIWAIVVVVFALAALWILGYLSTPIVSPSAISPGLDNAQTSPSPTTVVASSSVVPNAVIPQPTADNGQAAVFGNAPVGTELGGKNPPVTNKPVVNSTTSNAAYVPPVTDRPVVNP